MEEQYYTFNDYMSVNTLSASEEDYVEMIYRLCTSNAGFTRVNDIANFLNVKPPSVTNMLKRLRKANIIDYKEYGIIRLTEKGNEIGSFLLKRHNIIKEFLSLVNLEGDIHKETEKIEHTVSEETLNGINALVNFFSLNPEILIKFNETL